MPTDYVELTNGVYRVSGSRVSLDSIVSAFNDGHSPETIAQSFPVLTLEQAYGLIAYYLGHRHEVDRKLADQAQDYDANRTAARAADPAFYAELADARRRLIR
jgi:uncharacterized protein (DUF433 family)